MAPKGVFSRIRREKRNNLTEVEAEEILKNYKIPVAKSGLSKNVGEAAKIAKKIGYPIVLKIMSPQIVHKTDVKGLILNIKDESELLKGYKRLLSISKRFSKSTRLHGILVQKMIEGGVEIIIGGKRDNQFGQVLMFGGGGILTEIMDDVSFRVCPIVRKDAEEMIKETKFSRVLNGYRGRRYDTKSLIEILMKASKMLEENPEIAELDINPVISLPKGAIAVDARITID